MLAFILVGLCFAIGLISLALITYLLIRTEIKAREKEETTGHISPKYYGYEGGYDDVTICKGCSRTALYEDAHPNCPCIKCGEEVEREGS